MERPDRYGEGTIRARSRKIGLLYHRGYARRPSEVKRLVPELIVDYRNRWRKLRAQVHQWRSGERGDADAVVRRSGVAPAVATMREATKVALVAAAIGLGCVGLALMLREHPAEKVGLRVAVEYYATLLFFLAVSISRNGVWGEHRNRMLVPHADWLRRSIKETSGAYGFAIVCAWLLGTIGRSMGDIAEAMPAAIFWGGLALIGSGSSPWRRRRRSNDSDGDAVEATPICAPPATWPPWPTCVPAIPAAAPPAAASSGPVAASAKCPSSAGAAAVVSANPPG
jgi:hypothetical protein